MSKKSLKSRRERYPRNVNRRVVGRFVGYPRGFGFVDVEGSGTQSKQAIFVPPGSTGSALTGDLVAAQVKSQGKRCGAMSYSGTVVEVLERGETSYVGTVTKQEGGLFVIPDGTKMSTPIDLLLRSKSRVEVGARVVVEITAFSENGLPRGVVKEYLGMQGELAAETAAIMRTFDLRENFPAKVQRRAEQVARALETDVLAGREDLTSITTVTIDPESARDFDDAVSITPGPDGTSVLGVHIADVAHFVKSRSVLDNEAKRRSTSVYLVGTVVPMLPEVLSNGVCSLVPGEKRLTKSVFLTYDAKGHLLSSRFAETIIQSDARLTYEQAQKISDGKRAGFAAPVAKLVRRMRDLARVLQRRRSEAGMLHLDLPEVKLELDAQGRVVDASPRDQSFSHTIIELFMVEANRAVARLFSDLGVPVIRRIHPDPNEESLKQLGSLVRSLNHSVPDNPSRRDLRRLIKKVRGRPEEYPINLAVLRSLNQAKYSTAEEGHFALAAEHYCHFTSPIRRYPDLTVHRQLARYCRGELRAGRKRKDSDANYLEQLANNCSEAEHKAQMAENDLAKLLVLIHLSRKPNYRFKGIITAVTETGLFIQAPKFLVEGLMRFHDLGDEWWDVSTQYGLVRGAKSGTTYHLGDAIDVRVTKVDLALRHLDLVPANTRSHAGQRKKKLGNRP